jgi:uncharacterized protein (TIGR02145 family)
VAIYGRLYTWYAVTDNRNVCPTGWHVPSNDEWHVLSNYLGGDTVAAGKLKESGTSHWFYPDDRATNESGFTALPGGCRWPPRSEINGDVFDQPGGFAIWWTSTEIDVDEAYGWFMRDWWEWRDYRYHKSYGNSVRCIKDN